MTGKLNWPQLLAAATSLAKRPVGVAAVVLMLVGAGSAGVWLTQPADTADKRDAGDASSAPSPARAPSPSTASIVVPEAPAPPELTSIDVARSAYPSAAASTMASTVPVEPPKPIDWVAMPIDELRAKATANEIPAMEELARRLVQGVGVTKDQQAGAGWLLRAAQRGSAQSAFNVAVMYERGFVVERDSARAIEWYRKAITANLPAAKHNLALLLRDGKGAPRDGKEAVDLLRSAARQGMAASMFTLGDIHERGDAAPKDAAAALAWFAITAEFERQTNRGAETALAKTASQRSQTLQRILTPAELERAQQLGQTEFKLIVEALSPPKPAPVVPAPAEPVAAALDPALPPNDTDPPGWPNAANDQVRVIQQALFDLKFLRERPDGAMGPMTRAAIRSFQRGTALRETGEPTRDVYIALKESLASRDVVAHSPLPLPPPEKVEIPTVELPKMELPKAESPKVEAATADVTKAEAAKAEAAKAEAAKAEAAKVAPVAMAIDIGRPEPPPPPPTSAEIARTMPKEISREASKSQPAAALPDVWPTAPVDQVKAVQQLLRDLNFSSDTPDGLNGPNTRAAIRDYERAAALSVTGEPSKALFDSLKELRQLMVPKAN